jgi:hypothetical protein
MPHDNPIANTTSIVPEETAINPVRLFFEFMFEMWQALPPVIQALVGMIVGVFVFLGIMNMIRA